MEQLFGFPHAIREKAARKMIIRSKAPLRLGLAGKKIEGMQELKRQGLILTLSFTEAGTQAWTIYNN